MICRTRQSVAHLPCLSFLHDAYAHPSNSGQATPHLDSDASTLSAMETVTWGKPQHDKSATRICDVYLHVLLEAGQRVC